MNEIRQAIDFTANAISKRFGLDEKRVRTVLERTEYQGQNSAPNSDYRENDDVYTYLFVPSLARIFHESVLNWVFLGSGSFNCKVKKPIYAGIKTDFR